MRPEAVISNLSEPSTKPPVLSHEDISSRAREIWRSVGCPSGYDLDCWLLAESDLRCLQRLAASSLNRVVKSGQTLSNTDGKPTISIHKRV